MSNDLNELNNHLFTQLNRLNDEKIKGEELQNEVDRTRAVTDIAKEILCGANIQLSVLKLKAEYRGFQNNDVPKLLNEKNESTSK